MIRAMLGTLVVATSLTAGVVRVLQTNAAGDNIHVIDPATNKVVGLIEDIEVPHGITIAPDGSRIYVTNESLTTLDVVDAKTLKVFKRIPLSGRPNNVAVAKDGAQVYVGIAEAPGAVDVIDTAALTNVKSIPVQGRIHNVYVTPDGKHAVAGSIPARRISVIDTSTNTVAWTLTLSAGIRPMAFTTNPDGSTKDIIVQLSDIHGFAVVDFAARTETRRITLPDPAGSREGNERPAGVALARAGHYAGREDAVGHQQVLPLRGCLLAAGLQDAEGGGCRPSPGLAHHHAGRQESLCGRRRGG